MSASDPRLVVAVDTSDLAATARFYRETLGCALLEDAAPEYVMVSIGPDAGLCIDRAATASTGARLIFAVSEVNARELALRALGVEVHRRGGSERPWFSVLDPDGREVVFQSTG